MYCYLHGSSFGIWYQFDSSIIIIVGVALAAAFVVFWLVFLN